jgi:DNA polymerase III subunit delta'
VSGVFAAVVGQDAAVSVLRAAAAQPVHAYLFVGPAGSTKDQAARGFAALLMADGVDDPSLRDARLALAGEHPDVREVSRQGARILSEQVGEIIRAAAMAPVEGNRKVMILHEFHLLDAIGAARLLKTLEEPAGDTVFIVLADQLVPDLVTIASRCVRVNFSALTEAVIIEALTAEGVAASAAASASAAARGDLDRARVLAADANLAARRAAFADVPAQLDGTGRAVVTVVGDLLGRIEAAGEPLLARQADDVSALEARVAASGERGSGRKQLEDRHKRELRRHRTDELRAGLGVLAGTYRDTLVAGGGPRPDDIASAITRIHAAIEALDRNPNETLLLQALLLELPAR